MALSTKTLKVLQAAGLEPGDVALFSDEDLLGVPGVGPAVLADIRAMYPAPETVAADPPEVLAEVLTSADTVEDLVAAAARVGVTSPVAPPPSEPSAPAPSSTVTPGCTCDQPFRVTRTRQRAGRIERYCDVCGAVQGAAAESRVRG